MKINFSKKIYSKKAIKKAVEDYDNLANFKISEMDKKIKISLSDIDSEVKGIIKEEFSNHVLAYMKNLKTEK